MTSYPNGILYSLLEFSKKIYFIPQFQFIFNFLRFSKSMLLLSLNDMIFNLPIPQWQNYLILQIFLCFIFPWKFYSTNNHTMCLIQKNFISQMVIQLLHLELSFFFENAFLNTSHPFPFYFVLIKL